MRLRALKAAAYRHPDPYRNPIFCQFGKSRPTIHFRRIKAFTTDPAGNDPRAVGMLLWHPASRSAKLTLMHGLSVRLDREIGSACEQSQQNAQGLQAVSRRGRLGSAASGIPNARLRVRVAGVFDPRTIESRTRDEQNEESDEGNTIGKLKEPEWNGTLSADRDELAAIQKLETRDPSKARRRRDRLRWTLTISMKMEGRGPWLKYVEAAGDKTPFRHPLVRTNPRTRAAPRWDFQNARAISESRSRAGPGRSSIGR